MGNANASQDRQGAPGRIGSLSEFQTQVHGFFQVPAKKHFSKASVMDAWNHYELDDGLKEKLCSFIFGSTSTGISYDKLMEKVKSLVLEDPVGMADGLHRLLSQGNQLSQITLRNHLISVLRTLGDDLGEKWKPFKATTEPSDRFINFLIQELPNQESYDLDDLEKWLLRSPSVVGIHSEAFRRFFGISRDPPFVLPIPMLPPKKEPPATMLEFWEMWALTTWLQPSLNKKWRLLFSTRLHGESFSNLTSSILRQGPTLILVQVKNGVFGAYASMSWKMSGVFYGNEETFLFKLRPKIERFDPTGYNQNFQYLNTGQATLPNGLGIGGQLRYFGLFLSANFGSVKVSKSCTTFRGYKILSPDGEEDLTLRTLEVWGVGDKDPTPEEMGLRADTKPRGMDGATEHLMEMAGRTWEGKEYRKEVLKDQDDPSSD